jgi:glycine/D-amino acid oxidase-like deaminating enzyme
VSSADVVVVGAGVFGAWTAWHLQRAGRRVRLIDAYGAANPRASSGGETRLIRAGYGPDLVYTRAAVRSLDAWTDLERRCGRRLVERTGVLTLARGADTRAEATWETLRALDVRAERLERAELAARFPQLAFGDDEWGVLELDAGVLRARDAVHAIVEDAVRLGVEYRVEAVPAPIDGSDSVAHGFSRTGFESATHVFACGPWLPKLMPALLGPRMFITRQDVFFFGPPAGDRRYAPASMPAWIDFSGGVYGHADIGALGVKIAVDRHGPPIDPDTADRAVDPAAVRRIRRELNARLPGLAGAPLVGARVCQYENTANGDFLIDRHPDFDNVWLVGGGSGHGFKHGPFVGEYVCGLLERKIPPEPRFGLARKATIQQRAVY